MTTPQFGTEVTSVQTPSGPSSTQKLELPEVNTLACSKMPNLDIKRGPPITDIKEALEIIEKKPCDVLGRPISNSVFTRLKELLPTYNFSAGIMAKSLDPKNPQSDVVITSLSKMPIQDGNTPSTHPEEASSESQHVAGRCTPGSVAGSSAIAAQDEGNHEKSADQGVVSIDVVDSLAKDVAAALVQENKDFADALEKGVKDFRESIIRTLEGDHVALSDIKGNNQELLQDSVYMETALEYLDNLPSNANRNTISPRTQLLFSDFMADFMRLQVQNGLLPDAQTAFEQTTQFLQHEFIQQNLSDSSKASRVVQLSPDELVEEYRGKSEGLIKDIYPKFSSKIGPEHNALVNDVEGSTSTGIINSAWKTGASVPTIEIALKTPPHIQFFLDTNGWSQR